MADNPSSILLTREQSTGSNTNLWGGYLITTQRTTERALRGYQALTVTGDTTVSWTNYSATNDYGAMVTKLTGTPSAAFAHTLPGYTTFQALINGAGQTGTFKNSGGTGVSVPASRKSLVYGDGVDIYEASPNWLNNPVTTFANAGDIVTYSPMVTYVAAAITAASTNLNGAFYQKFVYTAAGGETSISGADDNGNTLAYTPGYCEVYLNGSKLTTLSDAGSDYTATTGTSITGLTALVANDVVEIIAPASYSVANTYTQPQTNALFAAPPVGVGSSTPTTGAFTTLSSSTGLTVSAGGATITGNSTVTGTLGVTGNASFGTGLANYIRTQGRATGAGPIIWFEGSDTNVNGEYRTKGTGGHLFITNDASGAQQLAVTHTASANRYVTITGSNGGNPTIGTSGGELSVPVGIRGEAIIRAYNSTAIPAGGTARVGYEFSSTAGFGVFFGSGAPTLSAAKGSLYLRSDGSTTNDRMYVNTNGTTTWTAVTTAA